MRNPSFHTHPLQRATGHRLLARAAAFCLSLLSMAAVASQGSPAGASPATSEVTLRQGEKLVPGSAEWVAAGNGLLAYGSGRDLTFALETEPSRPVSRLRLGQHVTGAVFFGRYVYLVNGSLSLQVLDLASPSEPVVLGNAPLTASPDCIAALGSYLLAFDAEGLKVLEVGATQTPDMAEDGHFGVFDPLRTMEIGFLPLSGPFTSAAVSYRRVYAATSGGQLLTLDLTDPSRPSFERVQEFPEGVSSLAATGGLLLLATPSGRILALDEASPDVSQPVAQIRQYASSMLPQGRRIYVAGGSEGLRVLESASARAQTVNVNVGNVFFQPSNVNINNGDTVQWTWVGGTHTVTSGKCPSGNCSPDGLWDSGVKTSGTYSHTFSGMEPDDYHYYCIVHGSSQTGKVILAAGPPPVFTATAAASPTSGQAPLAVHFSSSTSGGTAPYTYAWDFGDGSTSADDSPDHTYSAEGTYTASLTVRDSAGATASATPIVIAVGGSTTVNPSVAAITKQGNPFRISVSGSNFQSGIEVYINGTRWSNVKYKSSASLIIKGGGSLKALVPKNTPTLFKFENPDGGEMTFTFTWP